MPVSNSNDSILQLKVDIALALRLAKLRKARASRDKHGIQNAEMDYFQALQHLYASVQDALSYKVRGKNI